MRRYILWALPAGQSDRLYEQPMTSMPLTREECNRVEVAASRDGFHGFRRAMDDGKAPDFATTLTDFPA